MASDPSDGLQHLIDETEGLGPGKVLNLRRLSGGASRETWSFDLEPPGKAAVPLILQRARPGAVGTGPGMQGEARLLEACRVAGVPVPRVMASGDGEGTVGSPFVVVERLDGETIPRRILREPDFAEAREVLVTQAGAALAAIHAVPPEDAPDLDSQDQLALFRGILDVLGEPHPAFELAFRWLEGSRLPESSPVVVHGDFRLGNLLVDADGLRAVLDWELAHLGDPMEDLAWLCVRAWRFGGRDPVAGLGSREVLFGAYEEAGGAPVDPAAVHWWEVLGTLKWGIMCIIQAQSHLSGTSRSVELAAIGRRTCENEYDLLGLLP